MKPNSVQTGIPAAGNALPLSNKGEPIPLPVSFNYIGIFLTFRCPYSCSYCINRHDSRPHMLYKEIAGGEWIDFICRLNTNGIPITLQGGEPGVHPDFIDIIKGASASQDLDILTNLSFDLDRFVSEINPDWLNREAPYAPIRVSYHPEQFGLDEIVARSQFLISAGFRVGIYGILHPAQEDEIRRAEKICLDQGLDFRTKPFLGWYDGTLYGQYAVDGCCSGESASCECAPSELLAAPDGSIYQCHHHLYNRLEPYAKVSDASPALTNEYRPCVSFGHCNPCDVKVKNNRLQQFGHVSTRIRFP